MIGTTPSSALAPALVELKAWPSHHSLDPNHLETVSAAVTAAVKTTYYRRFSADHSVLSFDRANQIADILQVSHANRTDPEITLSPAA